MNDDESHPLEESLGNIHECALTLQCQGQNFLAMQLAKAHETIQAYLIQKELT